MATPTPTPQASAAVSTFVSLDCSLPHNGLSKAIQRTAINVALPAVFSLLALPVWLLLYGMHVRRARRTAPDPRVTAGSSGPSLTARAASNTLSHSSGKGLALPLVAGSGAAASGKGAMSESGQEDEGEGEVRRGPLGLREYLSTRMIITMLAVIFYFYPGVSSLLHRNAQGRVNNYLGKGENPEDVHKAAAQWTYD